MLKLRLYIIFAQRARVPFIAALLRLNIKARTVRYFHGLIYQKLGVTPRAEALRRAAELEDIR